MNTQTEPTTMMQATEAFPLEEHPLPANEVLAEQRAELDSADAPAPTFIP